MNIRSVLPYIGIALMAGAGSRLSTQLELSGFNSALFAMFAIGIVLIAIEPSRRLSERVQLLEARLAAQASL